MGETRVSVSAYVTSYRTSKRCPTVTVSADTAVFTWAAEPASRTDATAALALRSAIAVNMVNRRCNTLVLYRRLERDLKKRDSGTM
jgi:hypothetical protein